MKEPSNDRASTTKPCRSDVDDDICLSSIAIQQSTSDTTSSAAVSSTSVSIRDNMYS